MPPAKAGGIDPETPYMLHSRTAKPVQYQRRAPNLEELIQRSDFAYQQLQPIPLKGVNIQGLAPKTVENLGFQYFVVIDNTKYTKMSDIYKESRLAGKSNFVTTDSIIHPYLAFTNRVLCNTVLTQIVPDLLLLLEALQQVSIADYKISEDAEVREDIKRNIAYIGVAIKLLNPKYEYPKVADVPRIAEADLTNILVGQHAQSLVFDRPEDFSQFKPTGFYTSSEGLQSYYRCREWLSRVPYPIIDASSGVHSVSNSFRRSVLLFRALDHGTVMGKPAMEVWNKIVKASTLLGTQIDNMKERTLYPHDYKIVFQGRSSDLKVTINALAEPLFRTKLMLAIRKQKPVNLTSASIFELEDGQGEGASAANFRLFPIVSQPEQPWLRIVARNFPTDKQSSSSWPVGLLDMYAWGSPVAGNVLSDNMWSMDPNISLVLPDLLHCVMRRLPGGQMQPVDSRAWKLLTTYFKPLPDAVPAVLRSELWFNRRLLSAAGGWIDSQCAIAPETAAIASQEAAGSAQAKTPAETASSDTVSGGAASAASATAPVVPRRMSKAVPYHYLEPSTDLYRLLEQDVQKIQVDLVASKYMQDRYKARFGDFTRLFQRLQKISELELRGQQITVVDKKLLGGIDQILDKVDVPLAAVLPVGAPQAAAPGKAPEDQLDKGMNLAIGNPGMLYVIYQNPHSMEWTLGRGAVYTYYEMPTPLLTESMWKHKIEAGFAQPLPWAAKFQLVQQASELKKKSATAAR